MRIYFNPKYFKYGLRVLFYLYQTCDLSLRFNSKIDTIIKCYIHYNFAGGACDRKSTISLAIRNAVVWKKC